MTKDVKRAEPGSVTRLKAWPKTLTRDLTEEERRELEEAVEEEDTSDAAEPAQTKGKRKR